MIRIPSFNHTTSRSRLRVGSHSTWHSSSAVDPLSTLISRGASTILVEAINSRTSLSIRQWTFLGKKTKTRLTFNEKFSKDAGRALRVVCETFVLAHVFVLNSVDLQGAVLQERRIPIYRALWVFSSPAKQTLNPSQFSQKWAPMGKPLPRWLQMLGW